MLLREFCENEKFMYFFRIFSFFKITRVISCLHVHLFRKRNTDYPNHVSACYLEEKIIIKKWEDRYSYKGRRRPDSKK